MKTLGTDFGRYKAGAGLIEEGDLIYHIRPVSASRAPPNKVGSKKMTGGLAEPSTLCLHAVHRKGG